MVALDDNVHRGSLCRASISHKSEIVQEAQLEGLSAEGHNSVVAFRAHYKAAQAIC